MKKQESILTELQKLNGKVLLINITAKEKDFHEKKIIGKNWEKLFNNYS